MAVVWLALAVQPSVAASQDETSGFPPAFPRFPTTTRFSDIKLWLAGNTDLTNGQVILTSAEAVFAFTDQASPPGADGTRHRTVREEVINEGLANRLGGRSASADLAFDCAHDETTVDQVMLYPGNNLGGGAPKQIPAAHWLGANTSLDLTDLAQAACGKSMDRPYGGGRLASAPLTPPSAGSTPSPAAPSDGVWVQIGAFATTEIADRKWLTIQQRWPEGAQDLSERTETIQHGGKTLRRALVGPFASRTLAKAFCDHLRTRGSDCLVR
jgi:hypothetical protein